MKRRVEGEPARTLGEFRVKDPGFHPGFAPMVQCLACGHWWNGPTKQHGAARSKCLSPVGCKRRDDGLTGSDVVQA